MCLAVVLAAAQSCTTTTITTYQQLPLRIRVGPHLQQGRAADVRSVWLHLQQRAVQGVRAVGWAGQGCPSRVPGVTVVGLGLAPPKPECASPTPAPLPGLSLHWHAEIVPATP